MYEMNNDRRTRAYNWVNRQLGIGNNQQKRVDHLTNSNVLEFYSLKNQLRISNQLKKSVHGQYQNMADCEISGRAR